MARPALFAIALLAVASLMLPASRCMADVVKPALIEIEVQREGQVRVEIRASIEALLTGINNRWQSTQESPYAEAYDALRILPPDRLLAEFRGFEAEFLRRVWLRVGGRTLPLQVAGVSVPPAGYTKVPRISTIELQTQLDAASGNLQWYYPAAFSDSAVRVKQVDLEQEKWHWSQWQWIRSDEPSRTFSLQEVVARKSGLSLLWSYIELGFLHIVPRGSDHILFILGLYLFSAAMRPLLWQVTMFTIAHTLTLGLSAAGLVELPDRIVEPLIALSIAYVGIENLVSRRLAVHRLALVFGFGLLHGLGFASVLDEFGMPQGEFLPALVGFNIGVEAGQIAVLLAVHLLTGFWFSGRAWYRKVIVIPGSLAISAMGILWFIDRLALGG